MRIRTATAAAILATAAVLGSAGAAAASDNNHAAWSKLAQDFSKHRLNHIDNSSENFSHNKIHNTTNNFSHNNSLCSSLTQGSQNDSNVICSGLNIGKVEID